MAKKLKHERRKGNGPKKRPVAKKVESSVTAQSGPLNMYLTEINRFPLLTVEEEQRLARRFRDEGDLAAAHALVTANLRFVVKVAFGYRSYGFRMGDLIQEGNIGLMKTVQKFDPDKRIRFISYGVWWIKAYIQNYILKNWSLVKFGTTQAQRKLFFALARTKRELEKHGEIEEVEKAIAKRLKVKPQEVKEVQQRMQGRDFSFDTPIDDESGTTHGDFLEDPNGNSPENMLLEASHEHLRQQKIKEALADLDPRERYIIERRVMADQPMTLKEIGEHLGFSRERARQIETRVKEKLKIALVDLDVGKPEDE